MFLSLWDPPSKLLHDRNLLATAVSPAMREHAIMEETFSVRSVLELYKED
jgi:hypothetical protein